ncbi:ABC transporter permease [Sulfitobacter sp. F26204]|uniref:ABC transporter permease n=1 Tax=Sulfitobacter sp. F26204 TaxID=2996014 RepID=UPI00225E0B8E|nr:ABC transporter permease [Sulfitobacter sp. F26204]MCX7561904.1 ABC transporter permease [Sulfitobacter sp. F26204]
MKYLVALRFNALIGISLVSIVAIAALAGYVVPSADPLHIDYSAFLSPPSPAHPFGTDNFGRDVLSRVLVGAWSSLISAFGTVVVAVILGGTLGAVAGFFGGWVDRLIGILTDTLMAFPGLLMALALISILGAGIVPMIITLGVSFSTIFIRVVRSLVLSLREQEFVQASSAMGNGEMYTILRHILPNCISSLLVLATSTLAFAILAESALSFLGLGVQAPNPSWGGMLAEGRGLMGHAPWLVLFPGFAIFLTLLGINLVGDALRDWLDPWMESET